MRWVGRMPHRSRMNLFARLLLERRSLSLPASMDSRRVVFKRSGTPPRMDGVVCGSAVSLNSELMRPAPDSLLHIGSNLKKCKQRSDCQSWQWVCSGSFSCQDVSCLCNLKANSSASHHHPKLQRMAASLRAFRHPLLSCSFIFPIQQISELQ